MVDLIDFRERVIEIARKKACLLNDSSSSSDLKYLQSVLKSKTQRLALERSILIGTDYATSYAETEEAIERRIEEDVDNRLNTKKVVVLDGGDVCSICLQDINTPGGGDCGDARVLGCSHTFHWKCISEWRKRKTNCPLCRHDMEKEKKRRRCTVKRRRVDQKKKMNQIIVIT